MRVEQSFSLRIDPTLVWESLQDARAMAACLPGAELEKGSDPFYLEGRLTVRLGPIVAGFEGGVSIDRDESSKSGTMRAQGTDRRTGTRVNADISYALAHDDGATMVNLACNFFLSGTLAQFARKRLVDKVASDLIKGFADSLEERLKAG